jgi:biotin carboxyl carrier protein
MLFEAIVDGRTMRVEVRQSGGRYFVSLDGRPLEVDVHEAGRREFLSLLMEGRSFEAGLEKRPGGYRVVLADDVLDVELADAARGASVAAHKPTSGVARLTAPMPGKIVRVLVSPGQAVEAGEGLVVMEAMKMENELRSPRAGAVKDVRVREGQAVEMGALLVLVE